MSVLKFFFLFASAVVFAKPLLIVIDAGHGGKDRGAVRFGHEECEIVLDIAKKLSQNLNADQRFSVFMTRRADQFIPLAKRASLARQVQGDALISLHVNSSAEKKAKGVEFYFQNQLPLDEESMFLAATENHEEVPEMSLEDSLRSLAGATTLPKNTEVRLILDDLVRNDRVRTSSELVKSLLSQWQGTRKAKAYSVKQVPFHVISNVNMPSVLVEIGFLTNPEEATKLASSHYQSEIALGLYRGLVKFKDFIDTRANAL
jgi:N-acetylmuramoyl-L-alanine amidase